MSLANHSSRSVGELVDVTFSCYRASFSTMVTIAMLVLAPTAILKFIAPDGADRILGLIGNLLMPLAQGAITSIVVCGVEGGSTLTVGEAFRSAADRFGSLLAAQIATGLMVIIGLVLLVVPGVIAVVWTAVCVPVIMVEHVGYSRAIDRSRQLVRGQAGHVLGTLVLSWAIAFLLLGGAGLALGFLGLDERTAKLAGDLLFALVLPIPVIAVAFLYYDLRVRNEGADLDVMISTLPTAAPTQ